MIDLHTHSYFSDGADSPKDLIEKAARIGLSAIALTDHDTVDGCTMFQEAALKHPQLTAVNGCEFNVDHPAVIEIIALNIKDLSPYFERQRLLKTYREEACRQRIEKLTKLGFSLTFEDVAFDKNGKLRPLLAKPHIVNFLYNTKQIAAKEIGYKELLNKGCPAYVEAKAPSPEETLDFIKQTGAVSILAHPCLIRLNECELFDEIKRLKKYGLQGMEVWHSDMSKEQSSLYENWADELNLLKSGGSDYHGENAHPGVQLGVGRGQLNISNIYLERILNA